MGDSGGGIDSLLRLLTSSDYRSLQIPVLPHIVNGLILTSVFSAGNAFLFCASRSLAQMGRDGQAPKIMAKRNRNGVPYVSVLVCLAIALLSYCQVSTSAQVVSSALALPAVRGRADLLMLLQVITYLTGLVGAAQLVNWCVMSFTYIKWARALKAQGISRDTLYCRSRVQPYAAYYALVCSIFVTLMQGYGVFLKGKWDSESSVELWVSPLDADRALLQLPRSSSLTECPSVSPLVFWMCHCSDCTRAVYAILFVGWKVIKKTKWETSLTADVTSYVNDAEVSEVPGCSI